MFHEKFVRLNDRFRKLKGLPPYSISSDYMKKYGALFTASLDGELLAGCFNLADEMNMRGMIGATARLEVGPEKKGPGEQCQWAAGVGDDKVCQEWGNGQLRPRGLLHRGPPPDNEKGNINEVKSSFGGEFVMRHDHHKGYSPLLRGIRSAKNALDMMWNCAHWTRHALPRTHVYEGLNAAILQ